MQVLAGARRALEASRVSALVFELHGKGAWGAEHDARRLARVSGWLDALGYACYVLGDGDPASGRAAAKLSNGCFADAYDDTRYRPLLMPHPHHRDGDGPPPQVHNPVAFAARNVLCVSRARLRPMVADLDRAAATV